MSNLECFSLIVLLIIIAILALVKDKPILYYPYKKRYEELIVRYDAALDENMKLQAIIDMKEDRIL